MVLDEKNGKCAQELIARKDIQDSVSCLSLHSTFAATWNDTSDGNFYSGSVVRNPAASAGNMGSILDLEDPTCQRAPKPVRHSSWAYALEPGSQNFWACESQNNKLLLRNLHCIEKPSLHNSRVTPTHRN